MSKNPGVNADTVMLRNSLALARLREIALPFKPVFSPRVLPGRVDTSLLLELQNSDGLSGWGETLPALAGCCDLQEITKNLREIIPRLITFSYDSPENIDSSVTALVTWYRQKQERQTTLLSETALLTGALLDLLAREKGTPLLRLLSPEHRETVPYTALIPLTGRGLALSMLHALATHGFTSFKLIMGKDTDRELQLLEEFVDRTAGAIRIIVDFEGRLTSETAPDIIEKILALGVTAVEQPLSPGERDTLPALMEAYEGEISFILDLPAGHEAAQWCVDHCPLGVMNLSLSGHGGPFGVRREIEAAARHGWRVALGNPPGETSLSAAMGLTVALATGAFDHIEGNLAMQFLSSDITAIPFGPSPGGLGTAQSLLDARGCGADVSVDLLPPITRRATDTPFL